MRLSPKDFHLLQQTILHLYQARNLQAFRNDLPRILLKLFHSPCSLWRGGRIGGNLLVSFRRDTAPTPRDRFLLRLLRAHIEQAFHTAQLITALQNFGSGSASPLNRQFHLTARECEVAQWLAQGKSNFEIGVILKLSRRTVEKHVEHIFPKLGVENRATAAAILAKLSTKQ